MAMQRLSDIIRQQPWHPEMRRKYRRRMWIAIAVEIVIVSIAFYHIATNHPLPEEKPAQTVHELLEAIRPQIVVL